MPATAPAIAGAAAEKLALLGRQIRARRKAQRVSATAAAEAAGMSRVTLHRIEAGEPSVTMGAYLNAMAALSLEFGILEPLPPAGGGHEDDRKGWVPARIRFADYPQLKQLTWQALGIYERNWRHLDLQAMDARERNLVEALRIAPAMPRHPARRAPEESARAGRRQGG